jgi:hypothetical protein
LRYCHTPEEFNRRSFDIRRARSIGIPRGQPRELELDFGFRVWRLRADSQEEARRWVVLLEAARLISGNCATPMGDFDNDDVYSDDESALSSLSTADSCMTGDTEDPGGIASRIRAAGFSRRVASCPYASATSGVTRSIPSKTGDDEAKTAAKADADAAAQAVAAAQAAAAAMDRLEVDTARLDQKFDAWLRQGGDCRVDGKLMASGLDRAVADLWTTMGARADTKRMSAAETAVGALTGPLTSEPELLGHAVEHFLSEYLWRIQCRLERWLQEGDVLAPEVADVVQWFLFDAKPTLECFNAGVTKLTMNPFASWYDIADGIENLLLREWESHACDEVEKEVNFAFSPPVASRALAHEITDVNLVLKILDGAQEQWIAWRDHQAASERAVSVLIASLNAALRHHRLSTRSLVHESSNTWRSKHERLNNALQGLGQRASSMSRIAKKASGTLVCGGHTQRGNPTSPRSDVAAAAVVATRLAEACGAAAAGAISSVAVCVEVLKAFKGAFEREAAARCKQLTEAYFAAEYYEVLRSLRPCLRGRGLCASGGACDSAQDFLEEVFGPTPTPCAAIACDLLTRQLLHRWSRKFCRARPRLSAHPELVELIASDERSLRGLVRRWGTESLWSKDGMDEPVELLTAVRSLLESPSPGTFAIGLSKLERLAGAEQGPALADAVRASLNR